MTVWWEGVVCLGGCLHRGVSAQGCLPGGVCQGVSAQGGVCPGRCTPPPWTEFLTHTCENITFPQLRLRMVKTHSQERNPSHLNPIFLCVFPYQNSCSLTWTKMLAFYKPLSVKTDDSLDPILILKEYKMLHLYCKRVRHFSSPGVLYWPSVQVYVTFTCQVWVYWSCLKWKFLLTPLRSLSDLFTCMNVRYDKSTTVPS